MIPKVKKPLNWQKFLFLDSQEKAVTDSQGNYRLNLPAGKHKVAAFYLGRQSQIKEVQVKEDWQTINFSLDPLLETLEEVKAIGKKSEVFNVTRLNPVEGTLIYEAKKKRGYFN